LFVVPEPSLRLTTRMARSGKVMVSPSLMFSTASMPIAFLPTFTAYEVLAL